jgi:hypothetical protein
MQLAAALGIFAWLRRGGSYEEAEEFRGNDLRMVQENNLSPVDHDE